MAIISTRIEHSRQANGSIHVVERHVDDAGVEYLRTWFADAKENLEARAAEHAIELEADLAQREVVQKERADSRSLDDKLLVFAKEQPPEVLKVAVKLTDDEIAVLAKRGLSASIDAVTGAEAIIRG